MMIDLQRLETIKIVKYEDGSFECFSESDPDGVRATFANAAADWSDEKKFKTVLDDYFNKPAREENN